MLVQLIRTVILFGLIVAAVRLMGKRTIGELQAGELVVSMMLANVASVPMQDIDIPLSTGIVSIATLTSLEILLSAVMLRSSWIAKLISGQPVIVINKGKLDETALRRLRMTNADLFEELRKSGVFDIRDVLFAIVETDGTMSILKKSASEPPDSQTVGASPPENAVLLPVISDGTVDMSALSVLGRDESWLRRTVDKTGHPIEEIFLLAAADDGSFFYKLKQEERDEK